MQKQIEKRIQTFVEGLGGITRTEMLHGTLYIKLDQESDCDFIHTELRDYYKEYINPEGGVNMHYVGDEFAFDFVPADAEKKQKTSTFLLHFCFFGLLSDVSLLFSFLLALH